MAAEQVERWAASQLGDTFAARAEFEAWLEGPLVEELSGDEELLDALGLRRAG